MRTPKIHMINPEDLIPWDKNPRDNTEAITEVAKSIEKYGFNQPILCDQKGRICAGHTRREAAISLGMKKIPVIKKTMTESQFIQYNIADNKTGELADWDDEVLKEIMLDLHSEDGDVEIPGVDMEELDKLLFDSDKEKDSDSSEGQKNGSKRTSSESTKLVFNCTAKQAMEIDSKLDAIIRENGLDNQVEALLFALKGFKGNPKVKRVSRS